MDEQAMLREVRHRMHHDRVFHARVHIATAVMQRTMLPDRLTDAERRLVTTAAAWGLYAAELDPTAGGPDPMPPLPVTNRGGYWPGPIGTGPIGCDVLVNGWPCTRPDPHGVDDLHSRPDNPYTTTGDPT